MNDIGKTIEDLLNNRSFVAMVDQIAQRYGRLPHELLRDTTVFEFNIDMVVMMTAIIEEQNRAQNKDVTPAPAGPVPGFDRIVTKKE